MNTLIHADIFFFVTTIIVIALGICAIVAAIYIIKILRDVSEMSHKVKNETNEILEDVKELRSNIKNSGFKVSFMSAILGSIFKSFKRKKTRSKEKDDTKQAE